MELVWTVSTRTAASFISHRHRPGEPWGALSCLSFVLLCVPSENTAHGGP